MGRLRSASGTSIGQVRENNEDNVQLWIQDRFVVAVVADGMGGAVAGEQASQIAVEAIQAVYSRVSGDPPALDQRPDDQIVSLMVEAIRRANSNILHRASDEPSLRGMGTTMTVAFVRPNRALVAHVGDSRAYMVDSRTRRITQITADHSFVEALVAAGHLTHEQAEDHPMRNVLYRALGQNEELDIDVYEIRLRYGDRIVMCSDGLTHHVKAPEIATIVSEENDPDRACQRLIDLTNARGGEDNVSVVVIMSDIGLSERAAVELASLDLNIDDTIVLKNTRSTNELEVLPMHDEETLPGILNPFIPPASPLPPQRSG
ncbi:MAG: Stp1/IreP family PP2C-type Ser/Thr phosphatase [Chloroflexota bacterium]|nr:Stp1/IreP family PP2C-type Ser/Thr phosphatase [Chloroflexota bacterium]